MRIRPYADEDREACLQVLRSNMPEHFVPGEAAELNEFLLDLPGPYFAVEGEDGSVIACGGIAQESDESVATLCWGIVAAPEQRSGVGSALLKHRLAAFLPGKPEVKRIRVNTTQKVQGFFERHGFRSVEVRPAAIAPDLDHVCMERDL